MPNRNRIGFTLIEFFILSFIILILFVMTQPNHRPIYTDDESECINNQRLLSDAIEFYKIDYPSEKIENVYPGLDYEIFEKKLIENKCLLKEPLKPSINGCSYGYISNNGSYTLFCNVHGTFMPGRRKNQIPKPEYDKSLEKPFSPSYNDFRNKIIYEKKLSDGFKNIGTIILFILMLPAGICIKILETIPYSIYLVIIIIIISCIVYLSKINKPKK